MARPRIGLDVDGVLYDYHGCYRHIANTHFGMSFPPVEDFWIEWNSLYDFYPEDRVYEQVVYKGAIELGLFRYGNNIKGAIDGLRELAFFADIDIITSRPTIAVTDTLRYLASLPEGTITGVHILSHGQPKSRVRPACDLYIDDGLHNIEDLVSAGRKALLFDRPWNRDASGLYQTIPKEGWDRVIGWNQTVDYAKRVFDG